MNRKENNMDAVKFLKEFGRMCNKHDRCAGCPGEEIPLCIGSFDDFSQEDRKRMVEIVENWSNENPEEIGKKYIIEIDRIEHGCDNKLYHVKDGPWVSERTITKFEEYKKDVDYTSGWAENYCPNCDAKMIKD